MVHAQVTSQPLFSRSSERDHVRAMKTRARRRWAAVAFPIIAAAAAATTAFQTTLSNQHHRRRAPAVPATCRAEALRASGWWCSASVGRAAGHDGVRAGREESNLLPAWWCPSDRAKRAPALALMAPGAGVMSQEEAEDDRTRYLSDEFVSYGRSACSKVGRPKYGSRAAGCYLAFVAL